MRKLLNIFCSIAAILIVAATIFKIMHWPLTGIMMVSAMGFIGLFFLPTFMIYKVKEAKGFRLKLIVGLGVFCLSLLMLGTLFKMMHWPMAGVLLLFGMALPSLIVLPGLAFYRSRLSVNTAEKIMNITGHLAISCFVLGVLGKIMHWPGPPLLFLLGFLLLVTALVCLSRTYKNDPEKKSASLTRFAFVTILATTLVTFMLNDASKGFLNSFSIVEEEINRRTAELELKNEAGLSSDFLPQGREYAEFHRKLQKAKELSDNMCQYLAELRSHLIMEVDGIPKADADSLPLRYVRSKDNVDIPTYILIGDEANLREGSFSARELKNKIIVYRKDMLELLDKQNADYLSKLIGLTTPDEWHENEQRMRPWEVNQFYYIPVASVITMLSQIRSNVRYTEAQVIQQLALTNNVKLSIGGIVMDPPKEE